MKKHYLSACGWNTSEHMTLKPWEMMPPETNVRKQAMTSVTVHAMRNTLCDNQLEKKKEKSVGGGWAVGGGGGGGGEREGSVLITGRFYDIVQETNSS